MDWRAWEPTYRRILADFGYDPRADELARDELAQLAHGIARPPPLDLRGGEVTIAGPRPAPLPQQARVLATDAATWAFPRAMAIVTDLDGDVEAQIAARVPLYVHAHGDNRAALRHWVLRMRDLRVQPTTQAAPRDDVANYGGFTDGDRAACLAAHFGASSLVLAGFDFDNPYPKPGRDPAMKKRKLAWARRIIEELGLPMKMI